MAARDAIKDRYGADYVPKSPADVQEQGQERPGSARVHPADRHDAGRRDARASRARPAQALRPDLEAHARQPDGGGAAERTTVEIAQRGRPGRPARHRPGRAFDGFLKVYTEGRDDAEPEATTTRTAPPAADRRRRAGRQARRSRPSSTSPSRRRATPRRRWSSAWRSSASAGPRPTPRSSRRSRTATTSRKDKNRLIPQDKGRLVTAFLDQLLPPLRRLRLHRRARGPSSTGSPPATRTGRTLLAAFWRDFSAALGETDGPAHHRGARQDRRGAGAAPLPAARGRPEPRRLPGLRHRPARRCGPRATGGAFIGCSNYPECRYTRPLPATQGEDAATAGRRPRARRGRDGAAGHAAGRPLRPLRAARRGDRGRAEAAARLAPQGHGRRGASTSSGRCELLSLPRLSARTPRTASRSRPASAATAPT